MAALRQQGTAWSLGLAIVLCGTAGSAGAPGRIPEGAGLLTVREEWRRNIFSDGIGIRGLHVVDLDLDGRSEIVAAEFGGAQAGFWYVVASDGAGGFAQLWVSDESEGLIDGLAVVQADADGPPEVVIARQGGVTTYDGATREQQAAFPLPFLPSRGLTVADVDDDGSLEALFCGAYGNGMYVYDLATGAQEYANPAYDCFSIAVANVDNDAGTEIVLALDFGTGYVLDGATHAVEWAFAPGFGRIVRAGDVDGDGRAEIVALPTSFGGAVSVYNAETQSLAGTIPVVQYAQALLLADVDGDARPEIIVGDNWTTVFVYDGPTLGLRWQASSPQTAVVPTSGIDALAVGNVDGDAVPELLWSAGYGDSGPDHLFVFDTVARVVEWESPDVTGPFRALSHGDVDGDGQPELLFASWESQSGYEDGVWFVHDARTKALEFVSGPPGHSDAGLKRIANANVDADPQQEVFVPTRESVGGAFLICYDGLTHAEQWRSAPIGETVAFASMLVGNLDGDPGLEVVASTEVTATPSPGTAVYVFDAATGALEWQSGILPGGYGEVNLLRLGNVDADPQLEIVAGATVGTFGRLLFVIDTITHVVDDLGDQSEDALDVADRDGDGIAEMIVGTTSGDLRVISPTGTVVQTIAMYPDGIDALRVLDVTGDGIADYVFTMANEVLIRDGASGVVSFRTGPLRVDTFPPFEVGAADSLVVADVDEDGRLEIVVNIGSIGLRVFEVPRSHDLSLSVADAPDPALAGANVTYTWGILNPGSAPSSNVSLVVALPAGASFVSSAPGAPTCTVAPGTLTCALSTLAASTLTNVAVVVNASAPATLTSTGAVTTSDADPDPSNNVASATTSVTASREADLAVSIDDDRGVVGPGQLLVYRIALANQGPWQTDDAGLTVALPPGLQGAVFQPSQGTYAPGTGAWSGLFLASGQTAQLQISATVAPAASGAVPVTAVVSPPAGTTDPDLGNNSATDVDAVLAGLIELSHGTRVQTTTEGGDRYFRMRQQPHASYEIVIDAVSGDLGTTAAPVHLQRLADDLSVAGEGGPVGVGPGRSLRWETTSASIVDGEAIRVRSAGCTTDCGADDAFRVRAYDTTYDLARFNNQGSQVSVLIVQNTGPGAARGTVRFWSEFGFLLAEVPFAIQAPNGIYVLATATVPVLSGQSGSITVTSDAPYGALAGKVVSLDPSTGFSFDTPMRPRPR